MSFYKIVYLILTNRMNNLECKKFEIFSDCAPEACKKTCKTLNTACKAPCVAGCKCPDGLVYRDSNRDACIAPKKCPQISMLNYDN